MLRTATALLSLGTHTATSAWLCGLTLLAAGTAQGRCLDFRDAADAVAKARALSTPCCL